jgi:thioredoxin-related protein
MKKLIVFVLLIGIGYAGYWYYTHRQTTPKVLAVADIKAAMRQAYAEKKMLFILYGRKGCSNCQSLRSYIEHGEVQLDLQKFVYADINCDDSATQEEFRYRFKVSGSVLPIVVLADWNSQLLTSRSGYGRPEEFTNLIQTAGDGKRI